VLTDGGDRCADCTAARVAAQSLLDSSAALMSPTSHPGFLPLVPDEGCLKAATVRLLAPFVISSMPDE
jgi:hypothetical protein